MTDAAGRVWAIVVAAGRGDRFGRPKQFEPLCGRPMLEWSLDAASAACDGVVLVLPPASAPSTVRPVDQVAVGGTTRSASVRAGLALVPPSAEIIVVHDAARPLAGAPLFDAIIAAVRAGADGAVPVLPVRDTLKRVAGSAVVETIDRDGVVVVQTPQAFSSAVLRRAHEHGAEATDDAALVEACGGQVVVVPGDERNIKVTTPDDLVVAAALLR